MSFCCLREARKRVLDAAIRAALEQTSRQGTRVRSAFVRLLRVVQARTTILSPRTVATARSARVIHALAAMATQHRRFRRDEGDWSPPPTASGAVVLASLAEHLFALFAMPRFMTSAWLGTRREQDWYLRLAAGESVRAVGFPLHLTRAMAHAFRKAPDDLSIVAALRWAQAIGMGATPELAYALAHTRIARAFGDEPFIEQILAFFVRETAVDAAVMPSLVDAFLDARRRQGALTIVDDVWRSYRPGAGRPTGPGWRAAPFGGLVWMDDTRAWRIVELRTSEDLREEGIAMRHCVGGYAWKCLKGISSIWSLSFEEDGLSHRAVTIEVDMAKRVVCQVKGPANRSPRKRVRAVLARWSEEQGLTLSSQARG